MSLSIRVMPPKTVSVYPNWGALLQVGSPWGLGACLWGWGHRAGGAGGLEPAPTGLCTEGPCRIYVSRCCLA